MDESGGDRNGSLVRVRPPREVNSKEEYRTVGQDMRYTLKKRMFWKKKSFNLNLTTRQDSVLERTLVQKIFLFRDHIKARSFLVEQLF